MSYLRFSGSFDFVFLMSLFPTNDSDAEHCWALLEYLVLVSIQSDLSRVNHDALIPSKRDGWGLRGGWRAINASKCIRRH